MKQRERTPDQNQKRNPEAQRDRERELFISQGRFRVIQSEALKLQQLIQENSTESSDETVAKALQSNAFQAKIQELQNLITRLNSDERKNNAFLKKAQEDLINIKNSFQLIFPYDPSPRLPVAEYYHANQGAIEFDRRSIVTPELGGKSFRNFRTELWEEFGIRVGVDPIFRYKNDFIDSISIENNGVSFTTRARYTELDALKAAYKKAIEENDPNAAQASFEAKLKEKDFLPREEFLARIQNKEIIYFRESEGSLLIEIKQLEEAIQREPIAKVIAWIKGEDSFSTSRLSYEDAQELMKMISNTIGEDTESFVPEEKRDFNYEDLEKLMKMIPNRIGEYAESLVPEQETDLYYTLFYDPQTELCHFWVVASDGAQTERFSVRLQFDGSTQDRENSATIFEGLAADQSRTEKDRKNLFLTYIKNHASFSDIQQWVFGQSTVIDQSPYAYSYNDVKDLVAIDHRSVDEKMHKMIENILAKKRYLDDIQDPVPTNKIILERVLKECGVSAGACPIFDIEIEAEKIVIEYTAIDPKTKETVEITEQSTRDEIKQALQKIMKQERERNVAALFDRFLNDSPDFLFSDIFHFFIHSFVALDDKRVMRFNDLNKNEKNKVKDLLTERVKTYLKIENQTNAIVALAADQTNPLAVDVTIGSHVAHLVMKEYETDEEREDHIQRIKEQEKNTVVTEYMKEIGSVSALSSLFTLYKEKRDLPADFLQDQSAVARIKDETGKKIHALLPDAQKGFSDITVSMNSEPFDGKKDVSFSFHRHGEAIFSGNGTAGQDFDINSTAHILRKQTENQDHRMLTNKIDAFTRFLTTDSSVSTTDLIRFYRGDAQVQNNHRDYFHAETVLLEARQALEKKYGGVPPENDPALLPIESLQKKLAESSKALKEKIVEKVKEELSITDPAVSIAVLPQDAQKPNPATCSLLIEYGKRSISQSFVFLEPIDVVERMKIENEILTAKEDTEKLGAISKAYEPVFKKSPLVPGTVMRYGGKNNMESSTQPFLLNGQQVVIHKIEKGDMLFYYQQARIEGTNAFENECTIDGRKVNAIGRMPLTTFIQYCSADSAAMQSIQYAPEWILQEVGDQKFSVADFMESVGLPRTGREFYWGGKGFSVPGATAESATEIAPGTKLIVQHIDEHKKTIAFVVPEQNETSVRISFSECVELLSDVAAPELKYAAKEGKDVEKGKDDVKDGKDAKDGKDTKEKKTIHSLYQREGGTFETVRKLAIPTIEANTPKGSEQFLTFFEQITGQRFPRTAEGKIDVNAVNAAPIAFLDMNPLSMQLPLAVKNEKDQKKEQKPTAPQVVKIPELVMKHVTAQPGNAFIQSIDAKNQKITFSVRYNLIARNEDDDVADDMSPGTQYALETISFDDFLRRFAAGRYNMNAASRLRYPKEREPSAQQRSKQEKGLDDLETGFPSANLSADPEFWSVLEEDCEYSEYKYSGDRDMFVNWVEPWLFETFASDKDRMFALKKYIQARSDIRKTKGGDLYAEHLIDELLDEISAKVPEHATEDQRAAIEKKREFAQWLYTASQDKVISGDAYIFGLVRRMISAIGHAPTDFIGGTFLNPLSNQNLYPRKFSAHPALIALFRSANITPHDALPGISSRGGLYVEREIDGVKEKTRLNIHPVDKKSPYVYLFFPDDPLSEYSEMSIAHRNSILRKEGKPEIDRNRRCQLIHIDELVKMVQEGKISTNGKKVLALEKPFDKEHAQVINAKGEKQPYKQKPRTAPQPPADPALRQAA